MKRIFLHWPGHHPCSYYRIECPAIYCKHDLATRGIELHYGRTMPFGLSFDALMLLRDHGDDVLEYATETAERGIPVIWGIDDDLWNIPEDDPYAEAFEKQIPGIDYLRNLARLIIVSTPLVGEAVDRDYHCADKTMVCPNLAAPFDASPVRRPAGQVRVLVANGGPKGPDLELLVPAINRLSREYGERVRFMVWGLCPPRLLPYVHNFPTVPNEDYWPMLAELEPDIVLAPLRDNGFNRAKANIKWLEAAYAGAALIASDLPPYAMIRDGIDGVLVSPRGDWYEPLKQLIEEPGRRQAIASLARQRVLAEWSWCSAARGAWLEAFTRMVQ